MQKHAEKNTSENGILELATFYIGDALCGIDILRIQEINKQTEVTTVPQAAEYVQGVLNLRGRIVTIIDLGIKLGLSSIEPGKDNRTIIVDFKDEQIGLLVDSISDVLVAEASRIEPPPSNIGGVQGRFFHGVFKTEKKLIGLLDINAVLDEH
ncbi:chemotaxis protein CheW [Desulfobotulus sp. H1]|uniref:Chemotaxis protein CheW n=1 Tax=Desulfobotulus pelophilus TaxID=2823377 RepID=A0ABT3N4P4_9BACT|nr:chemotaxis protein CheW [Desulfobotulus pelophilus]MCW7752418.1 chemotaxis protein CheW [Desulfobotulus pelophilus]